MIARGSAYPNRTRRRFSPNDPFLTRSRGEAHVNDGLGVRVSSAPSGKAIEVAHGALLRHQQGPGDAVPGEQLGKGGLVASFGREVAVQESIPVELGTAVDAAVVQIGPQHHHRQQPERLPRPGVACGEQSARPEHQDGQGEQMGPRRQVALHQHRTQASRDQRRERLGRLFRAGPRSRRRANARTGRAPAGPHGRASSGPQRCADRCRGR